jgi:hypothetical protein
MEHNYKILSSKVRFIQDIIETKIHIMNKKQSDVEEQLRALKYPQMHDDDDTTTTGNSYNYLVRMPISQLTFEKKQALEKEADKLNQEIRALRAKPVQRIWLEELTELSAAWDEFKHASEADYVADREGNVAPKAGKGKRRAK